MKKITPPQLQKIHILLNSLGLIQEKKSIVSHFSDGRTESTKGLTYDEAFKLIRSLSEYDPKERLKSLVFSLAYQAGVIYGSTPDDKKINAAKLNLFIKQRGAVKKELNSMNYTELVKIHRQFEAIVKSVKNSKDKKQADKAVSSLLNELNLITL